MPDFTPPSATYKSFRSEQHSTTRGAAETKLARKTSGTRKFSSRPGGRIKKGRHLLGEEGGEPHRNGVCRPGPVLYQGVCEKQMHIPKPLVRNSAALHNSRPMMMAATQIVALVVE